MISNKAVGACSGGQQYQSADSQPYQSADSQPYQSADSQSYQSADSQPYQSADIQPYQYADSQPYQSADSQPYQSADSQPYQSADSQPYQSADSQPYQSADIQPYQSADSQPYQAADSQLYQSADSQPYQAVGACAGGKPYQAVAADVPCKVVCPSSYTPKCSPISTDKHVTTVHTHPSAETGGRPPQPPNSIHDADIPPEFKEGQYDVLLLYADADRKDAMKFKKILERFILVDGEPARICVVDKNFPWIQSQFAHMDEAIRRSTHIFLYITEVFCNDNWAEMQKDSVLMTSIVDPDKRWCVVPLYLDGKHNKQYKVPFGINALKGIDVRLMLNEKPVSEIKVDQLVPDQFIVDNIQNMISCQLRLRRAREKDDEQKLRDWREGQYKQLRTEPLVIEEQEERLRAQEQATIDVVPSLSETTNQAPDRETQHVQTRPATRAAEPNIVYNINAVENFQIGNHNTMIQYRLDEETTAPEDDSEIRDSDESYLAAPSTSYDSTIVLSPTAGSTVVSSSCPPMSEDSMATMLSADCVRGDVNISAAETNLKQPSGACSMQYPTESQRADDTDILKPESSSESSHVVTSRAAGKKFGIDVRFSDDEEETELMKPAATSASPVGDSAQDEDTDLKVVRVAGPTRDRNCTASGGGLQEGKTSFLGKIKSFFNNPN